MSKAELSKLGQFAVKYAKHLNWQVFPCRPGGKEPMQKGGYKNGTDDIEQIATWWQQWPEANIGLACGPKSGVAVVDVDVDPGKGINGWESLKEFGDVPKTVCQDTPTGGAHFFFKCEEGTTPANKNSYRKGIDIRGDGYYVILPPSVHPNGGAYEWRDDHTPNEPLADFPDALRPENEKKPLQQKQAPEQHRSVEAVTKPRQVIGPSHDQHRSVVERATAYLEKVPSAVQGQGGHNSLLWAASCLVRGFCLDERTALNLLELHYNPRCNPPWDLADNKDRKDFERKVSEARNASLGKPDGWLLAEEESLDPQLRASIENLMAEAQRKQAAEEGSMIDRDDNSEDKPWDVLDDWKPYPVEVLPAKMKSIARIYAKAHDVDPSYILLPMLIAASAAIGNTRRLEMREGHRMPHNVWGFLVGPSGANKSSPVQQIVQPLIEYEDGLCESYEQKCHKCQEEEKPAPPAPPRLVVSDITKEALVERLKRSPKGLLAYRDEIAGFFKSMDQYRNKGSDQQDWLSLWNGGHLTSDRKTGDQPEIRVKRAAVSLIGGIQPGVLGRCMGEEEYDSGMAARFLATMPPDRKRRYTRDGISIEVQQQWGGILIGLLQLSFKQPGTGDGEPLIVGLNEPVLLKPSEQALDLYQAFYSEKEELRFQAIDEREQAFYAKADAMAGRLALIIHCIRVQIGEVENSLIVDADSMEAGIVLARWHVEEAIRITRYLQTNKEDRILMKLYRWLKGDTPKGREPGKAKPRDLQRSNGKAYRFANQAEKALDLLVHAGFAYKDEDGFYVAKARPEPM